MHHYHLLSASHAFPSLCTFQPSQSANTLGGLALPYPSLPYIMPWSCVFLVVSFVWWSAVTNQSWNFKLRNKSVCFSCCNRSPQGHSWGLSTVRKEDFLVWLFTITRENTWTIKHMTHTYITVTSTHVTCSSTHIHAHSRTHTHPSLTHAWVHIRTVIYKFNLHRIKIGLYYFWHYRPAKITILPR